MRVVTVFLVGVSLAFVVAIGAESGCSSSTAARYPACERDDQCAVNGKHDYCVGGKCVYCRSGTDCADRERCRVGKCEADPDAPPARSLDAGDDADDADTEDADASGLPDDEEERAAPSQRHVLPRGIRRILRP
jgi:hypothetical protein